CRMANSQLYSQGDIIKQGEDYYHSSYIANTFALSSTIESNQAFLQQQLEQTLNTSNYISNISTTESFSNISSTNTTSISKQQHSNLSQSNKNTQYNPLANLFPLTSLETLLTKNINTSIEIDPPINSQESSTTNQFLNKNTNQT
ncbi:10353_t:CDS:1, partial [Gigaspora rosea]